MPLLSVCAASLGKVSQMQQKCRDIHARYSGQRIGPRRGFARRLGIGFVLRFRGVRFISATVR